MTYRYYISFQSALGVDYRFIVRDDPLDNEGAIRDAHEALEKQIGYPVVILNWKRID